MEEKKKPNHATITTAVEKEKVKMREREEDGAQREKCVIRARF